MRDWAKEKEARTAWIKRIIEESGAKGVVFGNSGGKDCALTGILCKAACPEKTIGVIMPCESRQNYASDTEDAKRLADKFGIETRTVDITEAKRALTSAARHALNSAADAETIKKSTANVNPRLRMTALYLIAQTEGCLVAGTGNRSENTMGYFTKWGDGGYDFNPIGDLTVREVLDFLRYLGAPQTIIDKKPSAGLWEGQTDEQELGMTYAEIDDYILFNRANRETKEKIDSIYKRNEHKRKMPPVFGRD